MPRRQAAITTKTLKRGPRKGQTIRVYASNGKEVRNHNTTGNARSGMKFSTVKTQSGQIAHRYANGKLVVVKGAPKKKPSKTRTRRTAAKRARRR